MPPPAWSPSLLRFYCCHIPEGHLLRCSCLPRPPQSSSPPAVCRSRHRNRGCWELGRTAAWRAGRTWPTSWLGRMRAGWGGLCGRTAGTESGTGRTSWTWTHGTRPVCSYGEDMRGLVSWVFMEKSVTVLENIIVCLVWFPFSLFHCLLLTVLGNLIEI